MTYQAFLHNQTLILWNDQEIRKIHNIQSNDLSAIIFYFFIQNIKITKLYDHN